MQNTGNFSDPLFLPRVWPVVILFAVLAALIAAPFLLRSTPRASGVHAGRRLVILSPHNERVRTEIGSAFQRQWFEKRGEEIYVDWRTPGGASEIAMFIKSGFAGAFEYYWTRVLHKSWSDATAREFASASTHPASNINDVKSESHPHDEFLGSNVGIGIDLLFGGGAFDFQQYASSGFLVASSPDKAWGLERVMQQHPQWFTDSIIPERYQGEVFRDSEHRWTGVVLASFGIVFNRDVLAKMHVKILPSKWEDLGEPLYYGRIALSDPTKSGSVAKAFELLIQSQMHKVVSGAGKSDDSALTGAKDPLLQAGWDAGLKLIQRICANGRYFTDSASKIALEVARGEAAVGMSIDSYGRATEAFLQDDNAQSRVGFVLPAGGSSVSVDPIGMLRGAPDPELATAFMDFVLSPEGQRLWAFRPGVIGGPQTNSLLRLPIRRDFYIEENRANMSISQAQPYQSGQSLFYRAEWTGAALSAIRFIVKVMCVDTHQEQRLAWKAIIDAGMPADALKVFQSLSDVSYEHALNDIVTVIRSKDKVREVVLGRQLGDAFRAQYKHARDLALKHSADNKL